MTDKTEVIIVGGGPVGLTTAFLLSEAGISNVLLESSAAISHQLRASTWHPPTLDFLEPYGITDVLLRHGRITPSWQIRIHETGDKAEFDLSVLKNDTNHPYRLQCEQAVLSETLAERLSGSPHADLRFGQTVSAVGQNDDGVWVEVAIGANGAEEPGRLEADYIIGCDGARSLVRDTIDAEFEGSAYPEITILATTLFPFESILKGLSGVNYIWKAGGTFSLLRLKDVWRCSFYPQIGETEENALKAESIQRHVDEISDEIGALEILEKRAYRVHQRIASHYRRGRIFIAGDAAHLNSPKGGMGMNGGIHDVFNLTRKIASVRGGADPKILEAYESERRPIARDDIIRQADNNRSRMNEDDPENRRAMLKDLQRTAADPEKCYRFLMRSSMIEGLRKAGQLD